MKVAQSRKTRNTAKVACPKFLREASCASWLIIFVILLSTVTLASCARTSDTQAAAPTTPSVKQEPAPSQGEPPASAGTASATPAPTINPTRAMQYVKEVVAFGPRPVGSANHKKLEDYILAHLKSDNVESDSFTADTPEGKFPVRNIIAKYPGTKDGIIVIAGHYDTNYPLRNTAYVGANDGGSSTAILLEFANHLRGKKRDGYAVWLVWTDGEEAMKQWSNVDSLYGTRHLAEKWQKDGTLKKIKALFVMDMIGDADLNIERETNSTPWLLDLVQQAATRSGYQSHFFARALPIEDDHIPFAKLGVPVADIIDIDYGYGNVFHHSPQDTIDKLSPKSLEIAGNTILE